jgi:hypothetical protein
MATVAEVCRGGYSGRVSSGCPGQLLLAKEIEGTVGEDGGENRIAHGMADRRMRVSE